MLDAYGARNTHTLAPLRVTEQASSPFYSWAQGAFPRRRQETTVSCLSLSFFLWGVVMEKSEGHGTAELSLKVKLHTDR